MKRIFFPLFLLFALSSFSEVHKFYLSVTEIEYNTREESLQIISRVFTDDMENVLNMRYNKPVYLTSKKEHEEADQLIEKYVEERLEIKVDGERKKLSFLGKQYDKDQLVLFIEVKRVPALEQIQVRNQILTGLFPDQKNVIHVEKNGTIKSLLLTRNEEEGSLNFSE